MVGVLVLFPLMGCFLFDGLFGVRGGGWPLLVPFVPRFDPNDEHPQSTVQGWVSPQHSPRIPHQSLSSLSLSSFSLVPVCSLSMHDLLFIVYAFLALGLLVLASPPHFRSANIGACLLVVWCFIGTLGFLVNAITWWDNVDDHAPVWCDICQWPRAHPPPLSVRQS